LVEQRQGLRVGNQQKGRQESLGRRPGRVGGLEPVFREKKQRITRLGGGQQIRGNKLQYFLLKKLRN
jgi:hypothetical protein